MTHDLPPLGPGAPTRPNAHARDPAAVTARGDTAAVEVPDAVVDLLRGACAEVSVDPVVTADMSKATKERWGWILDPNSPDPNAR